ncbi:MAG: NAD-dependent epimerase/dehydratase family protein [Anaerolineae bacterium]|nr:NAD-dependent epimerase/dehydratase family protein [Anaerolineae bacterium]
MTHILVTGGNGFIGSHLVDQLAEQGGHSVTVLDLYPRSFDPSPESVNFIQGDLSNIGLVRQVLIDCGIEVVYHLAWSTIHETALKDPAADIESNVVPTVQLLNTCCDVGIKRVVYASSGGTVYGIPQTELIHEDHPTRPINAYGITKLMIEKYLYMYKHLYGLDYCIFRPSVPYGPRQNPHRRQGAVAVFVYNALHGKPITIWGDGEVTRDYFYIRDMVAAFSTALSVSLPQNPIFNLAGTQSYTLNQLVRLIEEVLGVRLDVQYMPARKFDAQQVKLDISLAAEVLGWRPTTEFADGIVRTAQWIEAKID